MKAFEQLERLKRMSELIKAECTGTPTEFAGMLRISESHLYRTIEDLKSYGVPISYSKSKKTYYFEHDTEIKLDFSLRIIEGQKLKKIFGGFFEKIPKLLFFESLQP